MWWYKRAPLADPLDQLESAETAGYIKDLQESIDGLKSPDIRIYLGTIRTQMVLKLANDSKITPQERREKVVQSLSNGLENYAVLFSDKDTQWVKDNWKTDNSMPPGMTIAELRNASWLRQMIREFKQFAESRGLREVVWKPEWIGELNTGT